MANVINPVSSRQANLPDMKRAAMEAKLAKAIERVRNNYIKIEYIDDAPQPKGPSHLGKHIDLRV